MKINILGLASEADFGWIHVSTQYTDFVEIFNISLDLSTSYFTHVRGVELL